MRLVFCQLRRSAAAAYDQRRGGIVRPFLDRFSDVTYTAMRIVLAFLFLCHGLQKLFGVLGGARVPVGSLFWFAGIIETIGGTLIGIGLFTPCVAFIASGEMAVAYFHAHLFPGLHRFGSNAALPIQNGGELAVALCFAFLYVASRGGGRFSVDGARRR
jgi:putative oxidoreductase